MRAPTEFPVIRHAYSILQGHHKPGEAVAVECVEGGGRETRGLGRFGRTEKRQKGGGGGEMESTKIIKIVRGCLGG
jgi:hypothetical protein